MARTIATMLLLALVSTSAEAQRNIPVGVFTTMEACEASGAVYTPSFLSGHKPLGMGERLVTLVQRQCGWMLTAGGRYAIVGQAAGTQMVLDANGNIIRRWDCGNGTRGFVIPAVPDPTPTPGPVAQPPAGAAKVDVNVTVANIFAAANSDAAATTTAPRRLGFWCFRGVGEGLGCTAIALGAYFGIKEALKDDEKEPSAPPPQQGPKVTSDSSKVACTGNPCPGPPGVSPLRAAPMGLMIDPINRGVGLRIALPRRW
jgi:hypothetical protein